VGSGMGNDVEAALRAGARRVDAVDIDPLIVRLGRRLHPEKPYSDRGFMLHVEDARSFFHSHKAKVRPGGVQFSRLAVVFSSHTSLRLDNYIYTLESFGRQESC